eukprot:gene22748-34842_t
MFRRCTTRLCARVAGGSAAGRAHAGGQRASLTVNEVVARLRADQGFAERVGEGLPLETIEKMEAAGKCDDGGEVPAPTRAQILQLCLRSSVPFIGFGVFDNFVMLTVGDAIDATFGVRFGFSTLAAAGFGQCFSDSFGITLQGFIERFSDRFGLPDPKLTRQQERLSSVKSWVQFARTLGIVLGCLIGMFPLLFLNTTRRCIVDVVKDTLPPEERMRLDAVFKSKSFREGDKLLTCGEPGDCMFVIQQGEVEVIGRDNQNNPLSVCTMGPGSIVGELEIINNHPCVADVVATENVHTKMITKEDFLSIV